MREVRRKDEMPYNEEVDGDRPVKNAVSQRRIAHAVSEKEAVTLYQPATAGDLQLLSAAKCNI